MPHYTEDPKNPGQHIDVIELLKRDPNTLPPPDAILDLMRRDRWSRCEALLILAGYSPSSELDNTGLPIGPIYLDGITWRTLKFEGVGEDNKFIPRQNVLTHPLEPACLDDYRNLNYYAQGQPLDENRAPEAWLAWAESKGFKPYWLNFWIEQQRNTLVQTDANAILETEQQASGLYTPWAAAKILKQNVGRETDEWKRKLVAAICIDKTLQAYHPGTQVRYDSDVCAIEKNQVWYAVVVTAKDLNAWLEENEPRIPLRFSEPMLDKIQQDETKIEGYEPAKSENSPLPRLLHQEREILRVIKQLGKEPKALPRYKAGKPGIRADVGEVLRKQDASWTKDVFKKAWQRCRKLGYIESA